MYENVWGTNDFTEEMRWYEREGTLKNISRSIHIISTLKHTIYRGIAEEKRNVVREWDSIWYLKWRKSVRMSLLHACVLLIVSVSQSAVLSYTPTQWTKYDTRVNMQHAIQFTEQPVVANMIDSAFLSFYRFLITNTANHNLILHYFRCLIFNFTLTFDNWL